MSTLLPTIKTADWSVTEFKDSFVKELEDTVKYDELRLYFYAITLSGWRYVKQNILQWKNSKDGRSVVIYVGTDHGITDGDALKEIKSDGIDIRILMRYNGIFHPKVAWFTSKDNHNLVLVGSNNLTENGLLLNIEFATKTEYSGKNDSMRRWHDVIDKASSKLNDILLASYTKELNKYRREIVSGINGNFVWSKKSILNGRRSDSTIIKDYHIKDGSLILEIMPKETGPSGNQIQIPMDAVTKFFNFPSIKNSSISIELKNITTGEKRALTITRYSNNTARLSIYELTYRDRPCVLIIEKKDNKYYNFEIVSKVTNPDKYRSFIQLCTNQRRPNSRKWILIQQIKK